MWNPSVPAIRDAAWYVFGGGVFFVLTVIAHANIVSYLEHKGWNRLLIDWERRLPAVVRSMIAGWPQLRRRWWLWCVLGLSLGVAGTLTLLPATQQVRGAPSRFIAEITAVAAFNVDGQPGILNVIPVVNIHGGTGETAITGYSLTISFPDGESVSGQPQSIIDSVPFRGGPNVYVEVTPENTLWGREGAPPVHGYRSGRIWFAFDGVSDTRKMSNLDTRLTLTVDDSSGATSSSTVRLRDLPGPKIASIPAPAAQSGQQWSGLSHQQITSLSDRLRPLAAHKVMVACATVYCRDLASDFETAINGSGWNAHSHHGGGLGVDGVVGIEIDQDTPAALALQGAIEDVTGFKVTPVPLPKNYPAPDEIGLIVGTKPF